MSYIKILLSLSIIIPCVVGIQLLSKIADDASTAKIYSEEIRKQIEGTNDHLDAKLTLKLNPLKTKNHHRLFFFGISLLFLAFLMEVILFKWKRT